MATVLLLRFTNLSYTPRLLNTSPHLFTPHLHTTRSQPQQCTTCQRTPQNHIIRTLSSYLLSTMLFLALAVLASADYYGYSSPSPVYKSPVYTPSPEYKSSPIYTPSPYYKKPTPASSYLLSSMLFLALAVLASADYYGYSSPSPVYKSPVYTPSLEYKSSPIYTPSPYYKKPTPASSYLLSSMLFLALAVLASADYY
ncbi:hypothetical protein V2J09_016923 [Rumex salicifolius]